MDHYIDIKILPDPDFTTPSLMSVLFNKLHRALAEYQSNSIAISFAELGNVKDDSDGALGSIFRLHGNQADLANLMETNWLKGMNDHIKKSEVAPVPSKHEFIQLRRLQCMSMSKIARMRQRRMQRENETLEQATQAIPDSLTTKLKKPFVNVKSASTGQSFKLFFEQKTTKDTDLVNECNCYGIAKTGVLPIFASKL